ncbi:MAG: hypothetical protein V7K40_10830 [Nostoc sp.]|uniref:hypothetical protein n=1 Tax=Nostoc sp. TaxID=1180 RepID=UPI002FF68EDC
MNPKNCDRLIHILIRQRLFLSPSQNPHTRQGEARHNFPQYKTAATLDRFIKELQKSTPIFYTCIYTRAN